ncbi:MAG: hypothetical protein ACTSR0_06715 [Candidatus Asgardarchaeia archaeon]
MFYISTDVAWILSLALISLSILFFVWFVIHVEYSEERSLKKMVLLVILCSTLGGFGVHLLLLLLGFL